MTPDTTQPPERESMSHTGTASTRWSYAPYATGSYITRWDSTKYYPDNDGVRETYIGGDVGPKEELRHVATQGGIRFHMGRSRDGVGIHRLEKYATDLVTNDAASYSDGLYPFLLFADLYLHPDWMDVEEVATFNAVVDAYKLINDTLPPESQLRYYGLSDERETWRAADEPRYGEIILIPFDPEDNPCGFGAVACASNDIDRLHEETDSARVYIPTDLGDGGPLYARSVVVHELLHALGIWGHVDSVEFPDSALGTAGAHIPHLGYGLPQIDREILQILYMSQQTELYNDWGEWSDTAHHIMGETEDEAIAFGVSLFNGLPQPWAHGRTPDTALEDNWRLRGTATWQGAMVGYSGPSPLAGGTTLTVDLANVYGAHALAFTDIHYLNRLDAEDPWFTTRNMNYEVWIEDDNDFSNWDPVDEERNGEGFVTGAFLGEEHEHMAGTVKRIDMVGAFGGSRD